MDEERLAPSEKKISSNTSNDSSPLLGVHIPDSTIREWKKLYTDPNWPGSFSGPASFRKALQKEYGSAKNIPSVSDIKTILQSWDQAYALFKEPKKVARRNPTTVGGVGVQWQADLADLSRATGEASAGTRGKLAPWRYLLVAIDVFSRKMYAKPLKSKEKGEVKDAFELILHQAKNNGMMPHKIQTDKGGEFINGVLRALGEKEGFRMFTSEDDDTKASLAERAIRNVQEKIYKWIAVKKEQEPDKVAAWWERVDEFVSSYNTSPHNSLPPNLTPSTVNVKNEWQVIDWRRRKGENDEMTMGTYEGVKFRVGDYVRIVKGRKSFRRGYTPRWKEEVFRIWRIDEGEKGFAPAQPTYHLRDLQGEEVLGRFYANQLQLYPFNKPPPFIPGKVLKRRKDTVTVERRGYPYKFNRDMKLSAYKKLLALRRNAFL